VPSSFGVVLDACVLIPAALRDTLLRAAQDELYRPQWSEDILQEVQRNLVAHNLTDEVGARTLVAAIRDAFPEASVKGYRPLVRAMSNQPKDRHVLAAAVVSYAQVIVTINLRDFPSKALDPFGIAAQSPDEFLSHLFDLSPHRMSQIIAEQAADLQSPPVTVEGVLNHLATQHARAFAELIREYATKESARRQRRERAQR
jgi:predicted nucleic acid-binding protein